MTVRFASFLGDNALEFYQQTVHYLGQVTGIKTEMMMGLSCEVREVMVRQEQIQIVFTCGLPYVKKADLQPAQLQIMVAPVMAEERYNDQAVYFSDVIVRADSPYQSFADLRGTKFAFNEVHSLSGYMAMCHHLLTLKETPSFFGEWVESGGHAESLDLVEQGQVDAAAIDSVLLSIELLQHPQRAGRLRVLDVIGPSPMPPVAATAGLDAGIREQFAKALATMHHSQEGRHILALAGVTRFQPMVDRDYDPIRQLMRDLRESRMIDLP